MTGLRVPSPAAVQRHPHLAALRPDGYVRVDCHSHTMWSGDSTTTVDELLDAVIASGIDVLCITDHSTTNGAIELQHSLPCRVIVGEELRTGPGELLGLFLTERIPFGVSPEEFCKRVRGQGGLVSAPHPFDPLRNAMAPKVLRSLAELGLLDVIEVFNAKISLQHLNDAAVAFAAEFDLPGVVGSDAHVPEALGAAYLEMPDFTDSRDFLSALRRASVVGHHFDRHRTWTPRIVPSVKST
jgi:predicted metal-dependent phosphoesterase TrpH